MNGGMHAHSSQAPQILWPPEEPGRAVPKSLESLGLGLVTGWEFRRTVSFTPPNGKAPGPASNQTATVRMHSRTRGVMARLTVNSTLGAIMTLIRPTVVGRMPLIMRGRSRMWR